MAFAIGDLVIHKSEFYKIVWEVIGIHQEHLWIISTQVTPETSNTVAAPRTVFAYEFEKFVPFFEKGGVYTDKSDDKISFLVYMLREDSNKTKVAFGKLMYEDMNGDVSFVWDTMRQDDFPKFEKSPIEDQATD